MHSRIAAKMIVSAMTLTLVAVALSSAVPNASAGWTGDWNTETPMGVTVSQAAVVSGLDGTVYVMGGVETIGYSPVSSAYAYDPDTGDWTVLASMPSAERGNTGAAGLDGLIYVFGGDDYLGLTQIYDPEADSWSAGADMLDGVWEAKAATVSDGTIWVVGGEGVSSPGFVQIYDPVADSWSEGPAVQSYVLCGALVAAGDDLYYSGGGNGSYSGTTDFFKYDSATGVWIKLADLPEVRAAHASVMGPDGLVYVIGGSDNGYNTGSTAVYATTRVYDPATNVWSSSGTMDTASKYLGAVVTGDGMILALGGNTLAATLDVVQSMQLYVFDYSIGLSSSSVRAGESVLLLADAEFTYVEEHSSELRWALVSADDGTYYGGEYEWVSSAAPMALSIDVPSAAPAGNYLVVIEYWYAYADVAYEYLADLELELEVLPAADPADMLIADLEAQIADLQTQIVDLEAQIDALSADMDTADAALMTEITDLQTQVTTLESALSALEASVSADNEDLMDQIDAVNAALLDEIAALQDEITALQGDLTSLENSLGETNTDIGDVQTSVDDKMSAVLGYAVIGLLVVVILLLIVMMVMGRKAAPPPAP